MLPVMMRPEVGGVDEDVKCFASLGGRGWVGLRRRGEIAGWVGGRFAKVVDGVELVVGVAREDKVVVGELLVAAIEAEVEHDSGASRLVGAEAVEVGGMGSADELAIGANGIAVGDDGVEGERFSGRELEAGDSVVSGCIATGEDASDVGRWVILDAEFAAKLDEGFGDGVGPAEWIPDPF